MTPAIPKRFLPHSFTLIIETDSGAWGSTSVDEIEVSNVRIDLEDNGPSTIFFDAKNSTPHDINFSLTGGGRKRLSVRIEDTVYLIEKIDYLYAEDILHHLEITLGNGRAA
ncbi:MAG: minor capsid protein [Ruminococcus sp.]|jgi:hypothetical protein|nr:minor capsid protein [Ruminococcus sp.]